MLNRTPGRAASRREGARGRSTHAKHLLSSPFALSHSARGAERRVRVGPSGPRKSGKLAQKWKLRGSLTRLVNSGRAGKPARPPLEERDVHPVPDPVLSEVPCENYIGKRGSERAGRTPTPLTADLAAPATDVDGAEHSITCGQALGRACGCGWSVRGHSEGPCAPCVPSSLPFCRCAGPARPPPTMPGIASRAGKPCGALAAAAERELVTRGWTRACRPVHQPCSPRVWPRQWPPPMVPSMASRAGKRWGALAAAAERELVTRGRTRACQPVHHPCSPRVWPRQRPPPMVPSMASRAGKRWGALAAAAERELVTRGRTRACQPVHHPCSPRVWPRQRPPPMMPSIVASRAGKRWGALAPAAGREESCFLSG